MTKHDKPLSAHDKMVLKDLAELEKHGVPQDEEKVVAMDIGAIADAAGGPSVSEAMMNASGIGTTPTGALPLIGDDEPNPPPGYEGPLREPKDDDAKK